MEWTAPFAIYRIDSEGKILQVHIAQDIKGAKYWLTYIAQPGDVLCKTPVHPKHSKASAKPEYWSHKEPKGPAISEEQWRKYATEKKCNFEFPETQSE